MTTLAATLVIGLLAAASPADAGAYTFTNIDVPGVSLTLPNGINTAGQIVGTEPTGHGRGFLYNAGTFSTINVPGSYNTGAYGINGTGQIVGDYLGTTADDGSGPAGQ